MNGEHHVSSKTHLDLLRDIRSKLGEIAPADFKATAQAKEKLVEAAYYLADNAIIAAEKQPVETSDQPMEFWKSEAIGANTTIRQLKEAIYWALGERDAFPEEPEPLAGKYRRRYHWRTELRRRSGLPISGITAEEPPAECDHPRSELLASKGDQFEMRKCLECTKIFRVRLRVNGSEATKVTK